VTAEPLLAGVLVAVTFASIGVAASRTRVAGARRRLDGRAVSTDVAATRASAPSWLRERLADVDAPWSVDAIWSAWLLAAAVCIAAALLLGGPGLAVVAALAACGAPALCWSAMRHRADDRLEGAVPGALDEIARSLRSGGSLSQSIAEAAATASPPIRPHLAAVTASAERGIGLVASLEAWSDRRPLPSVRLAVAALCLGAEAGGAHARAIDGVAATVRQRLGVASEARALATQARMSAVVIAGAPVGFCALASISDPRVGQLLFRTPIGWLLLFVGLGLDGIGAAWMARLTRPKV
jgi:tight adherence protein B